MKKVINVRISLVCVVGLIFGIVSFYEMLFGKFWLLGVSCAIIALGAVVFACLKSKNWIYFVVMLAFLSIGFFDFMLNYNSRAKNSAVQQGIVSGRVTDIKLNGGGYMLYLEDCDVDGNDIDGRVQIYVGDNSDYSAGDRVQFSGNLRNSYSIQDTVATAEVRSNVRFELTDAVLIRRESGNMHLGEKIRKYIFDVTQRYMAKSGSIGYALLTGDRNAMESDVVDAFRSAGILHLLVVSGLHIGFIVTICGFVLNKLKLKPLFQLLIVLAPLVFYAYICNFTPSVMRAVLMTICVYLARIIYGKYDLLTSLCWAMVVILIIQPLYLFDVGFQLSVMSVFGIATVYLQIDRFFNRHRINKIIKKLLSALAMSFSCVFATLFVSAYYYKSVALLGIVVNLLAVPVVFVAFVLITLGMIPWVFHYAAWLGDKILYGVSWIAQQVQSLDAELHLSTWVIAIPISVLLLYVLGGYVNLKKIGKSIVCCVLSALLVMCVGLSFVRTNCNDSIRIFVGLRDNMVVATTSDNKIAIVGGFNDKYVLNEVCQYVYGKKSSETVLYITDINAANADYVEDICKRMDVKTLYHFDSGGNLELEKRLDDSILVVRMQPNVAVQRDILVQGVYDGGTSAIVVKVKDISVGLVTCSGVKAAHVADLRQDVCFFVVNDSLQAFSDKNIATISRYQEDLPGNLGANKYGNFTIIQKDDKIVLNFRRLSF